MQRAISTLIEGDPDGAWSTADICRVVYPGDEIDKKHRVAVLYALRHMTLPGTWTVRRCPGPGLNSAFTTLAATRRRRGSRGWR